VGQYNGSTSCTSVTPARTITSPGRIEGATAASLSSAAKALALLRSEHVRVWPTTGQNLLDLVHGEAQQILGIHRPFALPDGALEKMREIVNDAPEAPTPTHPKIRSRAPVSQRISRPASPCGNAASLPCTFPSEDPAESVFVTRWKLSVIDTRRAFMRPYTCASLALSEAISSA
jgi:hypothetical protein